MDYSVKSLLARGEYKCSCGKIHKAGLKQTCIENDAVLQLPEFIYHLKGSRVFLLADSFTYNCAGKNVAEILNKNGIEYSPYIFSDSERIEPDEKHVGLAFMHFDKRCDIIVGVGSGVINDIGKILASITKLPYIIVATAPSMDGFASSTSSVIRDSLKVSLDTVCPDVVIGDIQILKNAPLLMLKSGLGDMLAKYISICEWRIGNTVTGEYFCDEVANIIRAALKKCVDGAKGLINHDTDSIKNVMEGLVISGIAADYAGVSRPVSGVEHYFSHIWDMRALEFGTPWSLHGIQCGIGTLYALQYYDKLKKITPSREKALQFVDSHNDALWFERIKEYIGTAGIVIIQNAEKSESYNRKKHVERLERIVDNWDNIQKIISEELPSYEEMKMLLTELNFPLYSSDIGLDEKDVALTLRMTRDIRDKYILSALLWDIGEIE